MNNSLLKLSAALSILFFLSANVNAQETYNIQYKLAKGKSYIYHSSMVLNMTQEVMGKEMKINSDINGAIRFAVDDIEDNGDIHFTTTMDSANLKTSMMGKDTTVSLAGIVGKRVSSVISKYGEIKSCTVVDTVDETTSRMVNISQEIKRFWSTFAGKDVKVGESWNKSTVDTTRSYGGAILSNVDMSYTLAGKENKLGHDCLKIPFSGKLKLSGKGNMQGMDFNLEGDGTSSGTFYFDVIAGILIYSEGSMENDMTIATTGQQSMVIPITQKVTYSSTLNNN
jgi:hypothetical protein